MPWNDSDELVIGSNGQVYVAPVGTALPTTSEAALNAAFVGLGFVSEDGVTVSASPSIEEYAAWQSRTAVRRELTGQEVMASFQLEQWNEQTVPFAFGGGEIVTVSAGEYRYDPIADGEALDERAMVVDAQDGDKTYRWVFPKGNVVEAVESSYQRSSLSLLPVTFKALESSDGRPFYLLTNDPAFAAGS